MKAVITEHPFKSLEISRELCATHNIELVDLGSADPDVIIENAKDADAVLVGKAKIGPDVLGALEKCKYMVRFGTGFDNIDINAAKDKGIPVANVPDFCMDEVSDHAIALLMAAARRVGYGQEVIRRGEWRSPLIDIKKVYKLKGKVFGLFGMGRISVMTAKKAQAFGLKCIGCDPFVSKEAMEKIGVKKVEMAQLMAESDFLSLHTPLTDETRAAVNYETIKLMKPQAWIINTARGEVIDEAGLAKALDENLIAGAALDVLCKEPPAKDHPLLNRENVILTPHMSWMSQEAHESMQRRGMEQVVKVLTGEKPMNVVN